MNTTLKRRTITTDEDRYGGYKSQPTVNFGAYEPTRSTFRHDGVYSDFGVPKSDSYTDFRSEKVATQEPRNSFSYQPHVRQVTFSPTVSVPNSFEFSPPTYSKIPAVQPDYIGDPAGEELKRFSKEKASKKRTGEQMMPSIKKHAIVEIKEEKIVGKTVEKASQSKETADGQAAARPTFKLNQKAMLAVYIVIILAVAIAIIATGVAIGTAQSRTVELEYQLSGQLREIAVQEAELARLLDPAYLELRAQGEGLVPNELFTELPLLELQDVSEYTPPTNWFDRLSRFISNMF